ncbi:hypothetical protein ANTPLA_LOCUS6224 [Anthophora plagiata]
MYLVTPDSITLTTPHTNLFRVKIIALHFVNDSAWNMHAHTYGRYCGNGQQTPLLHYAILIRVICTANSCQLMSLANTLQLLL